MNVLFIMNFNIKEIFKKITIKENKASSFISAFETLVIHFKTKGLYTPSAILEGEFF